MLIALCNRCNERGDITSRRFPGGIDMAVSPSQSPTHLCAACLAELMIEGVVVGLADTPTARDYAETVERAAQASKAFAAVERVGAECDALKEKLQEARSQATVAGQYQGWSTEREALLEQIETLKNERDVAQAKIASAERATAGQANQAVAAAKQAAAEDPEYLAAVARREAKRLAAR
jgi:hypothetical protein